MWTVDSRCSRCSHKENCPDRKTIIPDLVALSNIVNSAPENLNGMGDGIIVMACNDFLPA
jgi:hypothetical protein